MTITPEITVTVVASVATALVSSIVTWYFSKRRYSRMERPITETDIEMEKVKNEIRSEMLGFLLLAILAMGFLGFFALLALTG